MSARIVEHGLLRIGDIVRRVPCAQLFVAPFEQWAAGSGSTDALADFLRIRRRPDLARLEQVYAQVAHGARARHDQHSQQLPREYVRSLDGATECVQASVREGACKLLLLSRLDRFFARHAPSSGWLHLWRSTRGARSRDVYVGRVYALRMFTRSNTRAEGGAAAISVILTSGRELSLTRERSSSWGSLHTSHASVAALGPRLGRLVSAGSENSCPSWEQSSGQVPPMSLSIEWVG